MTDEQREKAWAEAQAIYEEISSYLNGMLWEQHIGEKAGGRIKTGVLLGCLAYSEKKVTA